MQTAFLLLFLYLFLETADHPIDHPGRGVKFFFQLDPLALLDAWLASHAVAAGMLLSLADARVTLALRALVLRMGLPLRRVAQFLHQPARRTLKENSMPAATPVAKGQIL